MCASVVRRATVANMLNSSTVAGDCLDYPEPHYYYKKYGNNLEAIRKVSIRKVDDKVTERKAECSAGVNSYPAHPGYGNHPVFGKQLTVDGVLSLLSGKQGRERVRRARIKAEFNRGVAKYHQARRK